MLADYRVQVALGLYNDPDQNASNTWYFRGISSGTTADADMDAITAALNTFYQVLDQYLPGVVFDGRSELIFYNMNDPEPRVPLRTSALAALTFSVSTAILPSDVAMVLSYRADYASGDVRARKRGRMFFGPLVASVGVNVTDEGFRITSAVRTAVTNAAIGINTSLTGTNLQWRMYSPTAGEFPLLSVAWMDDQFDTRRSRDKPGFTRTQVSLF